MFICIERNPDGSHASQFGGSMQEGWAYWDENVVPIPASFPYVDIEVIEVHHEAVTTTKKIMDEEGNQFDKTIVLVPEFTQLEVVSATECEIPDEPEPEATQLDIIESQITYTAMMTNTLLEV